MWTGPLVHECFVSNTAHARWTNRVRPGRLVEIPAQTDAPKYFRLWSARGELKAELLTIIVTKEPIVGLSEQIGEQPLALSDEQLAKWRRSWVGRVDQFELADVKDKTWTPAEQYAGAESE